jgi:RimJ/RimL family protein N-acetyltransferase
MDSSPSTNDRVPRLETPRLTLRGHSADDHAAVAALWGDPEVAKHISGVPSTPEESWARMLRYAGLWGLLGYGYWAVIEKASGRFAGDVGLANFKRQMDPPLGDIPEAGWVLAPFAHGKGYATEAVQAVLAWSDATLKAPIACIVAPENPASIRVAEKVGFAKIAEGTYKTWPTWVYRREPRAV